MAAVTSNGAGKAGAGKAGATKGEETEGGETATTAAADSEEERDAEASRFSSSI